MKKNKKNAFTLVELLAVIVILAIILVIAVPQIMGIIEDSKKATFESTAKMIASQAEKAKVQNAVLGKTEKIECNDVAKLNNIDYESCIIEFDDNDALITMTGSGKFEGLYICYGTKTGASVQEQPCSGAETEAACFDYELVYDVKPGNKTNCINYTKDTFLSYGYTEEELNTFCEGNIVNSYTFSQMINKMIYEEKTTIDNLVSNNVVSNAQQVVEITGYDSTCGAEVNVPRKLNNTLVYGIGNNAFQGTTITSINFPTSLRYIGDSAFLSTESTDAYGTTDPYASTNPYEDTYAPTGSVQITGGLDLSNLDKLETIGSEAFSTNQITSVKFPNNLVAIGDKAFSSNQISGELDLSNTNLETIGSGAFRNNKITSVKFANNLVTIRDDAFSINQISGVLDLSNTKVLSIGKYAFSSNKITSVKLPKSITSIDTGAFDWITNPNLTTIINPSGKSFDWRKATLRNSSAVCTFVTGVCVDITIKAS